MNPQANKINKANDRMQGINVTKLSQGVFM